MNQDLPTFQRLLRRLIGLVNFYVLRHAWMRISWQEDDAGRVVPRSWRLHFPLHPRRWYGGGKGVVAA